MPTGLTYVVVEDPPYSFEQFLLRAARQMIPLMSQREEDGDALPRLPDPDSIARARAALDYAETQVVKARAMSLDDAAAAAAKSYAKQLAQREELAQTHALRHERVNSMLVRVEAWEPPSPEHVPLKKLMLEQLRDTYDEYGPPTATPPKKYFAEEWRELHVRWYAEDLVREQERFERAKKNFAYNTAWVTALYESLGMKPIAHDDFKTNPFKKNLTGDE